MQFSAHYLESFIIQLIFVQQEVKPMMNSWHRCQQQPEHKRTYLILENLQGFFCFILSWNGFECLIWCKHTETGHSRSTVWMVYNVYVCRLEQLYHICSFHLITFYLSLNNHHCLVHFTSDLNPKNALTSYWCFTFCKKSARQSKPLKFLETKPLCVICIHACFG